MTCPGIRQPGKGWQEAPEPTSALVKRVEKGVFSTSPFPAGSVFERGHTYLVLEKTHGAAVFILPNAVTS